MTITFHTRFPNTAAKLSLDGAPDIDMMTDAEGNFYVSEATDGTHTYTVIINLKPYTGKVEVTNNTGYVDVTASISWLWFGAMAGLAFVIVAIIVVTDPQ